MSMILGLAPSSTARSNDICKEDPESLSVPSCRNGAIKSGRLTCNGVPVVFVCLYPEQTLPSMLDLRLIANPRRPWQ
jgi:hypothetical protein